MRPHEKGTVEQGVRFMRRNLLVPLLSFDDFDTFNKELLDKSKDLLKKEHYVLKQAIIDLHFEDITELNQLPTTPFEPSSIVTRKIDNYGRLTTEGRLYYYLSPSYAYKKIQVKFLSDTLEIYEEDGKHIMNVPRLSATKGARYINWSPYIRLLSVKPAAMYNFSFLDLFTDKDIVERITKLNSYDLKIFLEKFADMIDSAGLNEAINKVTTLLKDD
jgi:transposase (25)